MFHSITFHEDAADYLVHTSFYFLNMGLVVQQHSCTIKTIKMILPKAFISLSV